MNQLMLVLEYHFPILSTEVDLFPFQVHYYVQSHIQINEYRDRIILVSVELNAQILIFMLTHILLMFVHITLSPC